MKSIEYMVKEHDEISKFLDRLEEECINLMNTKYVNEEFFLASIEFIRKYADGIHHMKEEDILFKYMIDNLGPMAEKVVKNGMLVEHQLARGHVFELENSLKIYKDNMTDKSIIAIIGHAMSYVNLLRSHINKENTTVYTFAENNLSDNIKKIIEEETEDRINMDKEFNEQKENLIKIIFA